MLWYRVKKMTYVPKFDNVWMPSISEQNLYTHTHTQNYHWLLDVGGIDALAMFVCLFVYSCLIYILLFLHQHPSPNCFCRWSRGSKTRSIKWHVTTTSHLDSHFPSRGTMDAPLASGVRAIAKNVLLDLIIIENGCGAHRERGTKLKKWGGNRINHDDAIYVVQWGLDQQNPSNVDSMI